MKIFIARHGETIQNKKGIFQGQIDGELSQKGIEENKKLSIYLKNFKFEHIYSSDLKRALDSANEITKFHKSTPFTITKELRERNLGEFQGKSKTELKDKYLALKNNKITPKNGESLQEMFNRAKNFYLKLVQIHSAKDQILLMTHGRIAKAMMSFAKDKNENFIKDMEKLANTSLSIIEIDKDQQSKISLYNSTKHL